MRALRGAGTALLLLALATAARAQDYGASIGWYVGAIHSTALNSGAAAVTVNGAAQAPEAIQPDLGWLAGAFYERWLGAGYVGYRFNGALSQSAVPWNGINRNVRMWLGDVDLVLRPVNPEGGHKVFPFLAAGAGGVIYDMGRGLPVSFDAANAMYSGRQNPRFAAAVSGGIDIVTPWSADFSPILVRLQVGDHMVLRSPFSPLIGGGSFDPVHQLHAELSLHAGVGSLHGEATRVR